MCIERTIRLTRREPRIIHKAEGHSWTVEEADVGNWDSTEGRTCECEKTYLLLRVDHDDTCEGKYAEHYSDFECELCARLKNLEEWFEERRYWGWPIDEVAKREFVGYLSMFYDVKGWDDVEEIRRKGYF